MFPITILHQEDSRSVYSQCNVDSLAYTEYNENIGHSKSFMITISPTYLLIWKRFTFVGLCVAFWGIFTRQIFPQITHANHMTMTTNDYLKTKGNMNIKFINV